MLEKIYATAKTKAYPDKTIAFVMGERDGLDVLQARKIQALFSQNGYYVHEISPEEFEQASLINSEGFTRTGRFALIPHAESFPVDKAPAVSKFISDGGKLMVLGGPLFGAYDGADKLPSYEGLFPFYKLYTVESCKDLRVCENGFSKAALSLPGDFESTVVCPVARSDGYGFDMDRNARIIPVATAHASPDETSKYNRLGSFRGNAAYFALANTEGHLVRTNATKAGSVSCTNLGSAVAVIGLKTQELLSIGGMDTLLCDMLKALDRGVFLFEGGADKYVIDKGEGITLGAKIMSTALYHADATVCFTIQKDKITLFTRNCEVFLGTQNFTTIKEPLNASECANIFKDFGTYTVKTDIILHGGEYIQHGVEAFCGIYGADKDSDNGVYEEFITRDRYTSDTLVDSCVGEIILNDKTAVVDESEIVTVEDGKFMLGGKEWIMYGFNYWPLYHVSLEHNDYWLGEFDKRNYVQSEVDTDLGQLVRMGMNCIAVRIDGGSPERFISPLRDFFKRCEKYGLKVMLGTCNITTPMYFQENAFKNLLEKTGVHKSPALFSYDIAWEVGRQFSMGYSSQWRDAWTHWLCEQFGSIDAAESAIGTRITRDSGGSIRCPSDASYHNAEGANAKLYSVFTRFLENFAGRCYNKAVAAIKKHDPVHLIGSRAESLSEFCPNIVLSGVGKHLDYMGLEGYSQTIDNVGLAAGIAMGKAAEFLSNGKPLTLIEYGLNLVGISGNATGTKTNFDAARLRPFDNAFDEQDEYQVLYHRIMEMCGFKGTLPWFYAGGFRSTEYSDCGHVNPDGTLRPCAMTYIKRKADLENALPDKASRKKVIVDPDKYSNSWSRIVFGKGLYARPRIMRLEIEGKPVPTDREHGEGLLAGLDFIKNGIDFEFATEGTGKTSADVELKPCANLDIEVNAQSRLPIKHLDSEFNSVIAEYLADGKVCVVDLKKHQRLTVPLGTTIRFTVNLGNVSEAKWLAPIPDKSNYGCVYIGSLNKQSKSLLMPLESDVAKFCDGTAHGEMPFDSPETIVELRALSTGRTSFGEVFPLTIVCQ